MLILFAHLFPPKSCRGTYPVPSILNLRFSHMTEHYEPATHLYYAFKTILNPKLYQERISLSK